MSGSIVSHRNAVARKLAFKKLPVAATALTSLCNRGKFEPQRSRFCPVLVQFRRSQLLVRHGVERGHGRRSGRRGRHHHQQSARQLIGDSRLVLIWRSRGLVFQVFEVVFFLASSFGCFLRELFLPGVTVERNFSLRCFGDCWRMLF